MIFFASGTVPVAAAKTSLAIFGSATLRPRIIRYDWAVDGVPSGDQAFIVAVRDSTTTLGTSTAYTPRNADRQDATAAQFTAGITFTVEPGYTAGFITQKPVNPRVLHQWWATFPEEEIEMAAVASQGVGWQLTQVGSASGNLIVNATVRSG